MSTVNGLWRDGDGLTTVEYALLLALLVAIAISGWETFGQRSSANDSSDDTTDASAGLA